MQAIGVPDRLRSGHAGGLGVSNRFGSLRGAGCASRAAVEEMGLGRGDGVPLDLLAVARPIDCSGAISRARRTVGGLLKVAGAARPVPATGAPA